MSIQIPTQDLVLDDDGGGSNPLRPISYLGSKLRSVKSILQVRNQIFRDPITVLDPFSGSSVVAQAFANAGDTVIASDALKMCTDMAAATIQGREDQLPLLFEAADKILESPHVPGFEMFQEIVDEEKTLISRELGADLIAFSMRVPQVWRDEHCSKGLRYLFASLRKNATKEIREPNPVITSFYAGTYFGVFQSLEIDRLWHAILALQRDGKVNTWIISSLLTALYSASSSCTFTAGKHFAQPYIIGPDRTNDYALRRVIEDRSISVSERFRACIREIARTVSSVERRNRVYSRSLEDWSPDEITKDGIELIYADPPYTAQQYSRFYHVTETLAHGRIPDLQVFRGAVTRGLYPSSRFKSRFCSKRSALAGFDHLLRLGVESGASIILSYSFSNSTTGNARMVELGDILSLGAIKSKALLPTLYRLPHQYRPFSSNKHHGADDWEALILLANHASKISR